MSSIFSKIVSGEIPSYKIAEEKNFFAFLDINPLAKGHALVIPKKEIDYVFDIDDDMYKELLLFTKKVASAIEKNVKCIRMGMVIYGLDVPHAHIHLIPLLGSDDIDFKKPPLKLTSEEFKEIAERISDEFEKIK